jgi:hypothetical protein
LKLYGVAAVRERLLDSDARLVKESGKAVIELNSLFPGVRRRFSLAHEIGHLVLNQCAQKGLFEESHGDTVAENICNEVAAELLVPQWALQEHVASTPVLDDWTDPLSASAIIRAARVFDVSIEMLAKRVFHDLSMAPNSVAVIWRVGPNRKTPDSGDALRVRSVWQRPESPYFVPANKTAPRHSAIQLAYERGGKFRSQEQTSLGSMKGPLIVDAASFNSFSAPKADPRGPFGHTVLRVNPRLLENP